MMKPAKLDLYSPPVPAPTPSPAQRQPPSIPDHALRLPSAREVSLRAPGARPGQFDWSADSMADWPEERDDKSNTPPASSGPGWRANDAQLRALVDQMITTPVEATFPGSRLAQTGGQVLRSGGTRILVHEDDEERLLLIFEEGGVAGSFDEPYEPTGIDDLDDLGIPLPGVPSTPSPDDLAETHRGSVFADLAATAMLPEIPALPPPPLAGVSL